MPKIDLNADIGEGCDSDAELIPLLTSANVACGAHAGDAEAMRAAVAACHAAGVAIGAHPGHADREHFGRRELEVARDGVERLVGEQLGALDAILNASPGPTLRYLKPHGSLYHQASRDAELARGLVAAAAAYRNEPLPILGPAGSKLEQAAAEAGLAFYAEAFADRAYRDGGTLAPRSTPGAVLTDPTQAAEQAVRLATEGHVRTLTGAEIDIRCDSLCLHGDTPGAVANARAVRAALEAAGVTLRAFTA